GDDVIATQGDQGIEGQGHEFQAQIYADQVAGGDHDHLAQQGHQRQNVELAAAQHVTLLRVDTAVDQRHGDGDIGRDLEQVREVVSDVQAVERAAYGAAIPLQQRYDGHHTQCQQREHKRGLARRMCADGIDQQDCQTEYQQQNLGRSQCEINVRLHHESVLQFRDGNVLQQGLDRSMHNVGEGLGIDPHVQHSDSHHAENQEFAAVDIGELTHMVVGDIATGHALDQP